MENQLKNGAVLKGKWKIVPRRHCCATFDGIWYGRDIFTGDPVAIKVEPVVSERQLLKVEVALLRKVQTCPWVVPYLGCGRHGEHNFLVMKRLGTNISELRRIQSGRFSMTTTLKLGIQMIKGIEGIHDLGMIHRDIKPSNFAMGLEETPKRQTCFLLDFGIGRVHLLPNGAPRPPREEGNGFRGTARYASIHSHLNQDLGRRDDLWSLFYLLVEAALGELPWRKLRNKDQIGEMKVNWNNDDLVAGLPEEFLLFMRYLSSLEYQSRPDYTYLINMFENLYMRLGGDETTPYDWEEKADLPLPVVEARPIPSLVDFSFVKLMANFETLIESADQSLLLRIPSEIKKRMIEFLLRSKEGKFPHKEKLLNNQMKELNLVQSQMSVEELGSIAQIFTDLRSLKLGQCTDEVVVKFVEKNRHLEEIVLNSSRITNQCLKSFSNCPKLRSIEIINNKKIGDKGVEVVLKTCENLAEVSFKNCKKIQGGGFKLSVEEKSSLSKIDVSNCPLERGGFKQLLKISKNLEVLILRPLILERKIAEKGLPSLIQRCQTIKRLELSAELSQDQLSKVLVNISQNCKQLEVLHIGAQVLVEQMVDLLVHCKYLKEISVSQENDTGLVATTLLRQLINCSSIKRVHIKFGEPLYKLSSLSNSNLKTFLHSHEWLSELSLVGCQILGQECWPDKCFFRVLKKLDLSDCIQLEDDMISCVTKSTPFLTTLKINCLNGLHCASLDSIALHCPLLRECEMKGCVCFLDEDLLSFLQHLPLVFLLVTRYTKRDIVDKEINFSNAEEIFRHYPNDQDLIQLRMLDFQKSMAC